MLSFKLLLGLTQFCNLTTRLQAKAKWISQSPLLEWPTSHDFHDPLWSKNLSSHHPKLQSSQLGLPKYLVIYTAKLQRQKLKHPAHFYFFQE